VRKFNQVHPGSSRGGRPVAVGERVGRGKDLGRRGEVHLQGAVGEQVRVQGGTPVVRTAWGSREGGRGERVGNFTKSAGCSLGWEGSLGTGS